LSSCREPVAAADRAAIIAAHPPYLHDLRQKGSSETFCHAALLLALLGLRKSQPV
jgi:hypothetical protein